MMKSHSFQLQKHLLRYIGVSLNRFQLMKLFQWTPFYFLFICCFLFLWSDFCKWKSSWIHGFFMRLTYLINFTTTFFISWRSMRQTSQPSGAEKKEAMKQAFKANSSRSSRGGQDTQSAKAEKAEKADVSSKKPTGTSTSSLRYRPFNFLLMYRCTILQGVRAQICMFWTPCVTWVLNLCQPIWCGPY